MSYISRHRTNLVRLALVAALIAAVYPGVRQLSARQAAIDESTTVCFPTCQVNDARFLVVAGDDPTTFAAVDVLVGVSAPIGSTEVHFGVFDGDTTANWDKPVTSTPPPPLEIELWADPDRLGPTSPNAVLLKTYTPGGPFSIPFANSAWADVFENHTAVDPTGQAATPFAHRYTLRFRAVSPATNKGWNAFKVRSTGTLGVFAETFAFLGAYTHSVDRTTVYPNFATFALPGPSPYTGKWQFGFSVPAGVTSFDVWDGDFDFGNCSTNEDDDDPNTPNEVPFFAIGSSARAEGVGRVQPGDGGGLMCSSGPSAGLYPTGLPVDDNGTAVFERKPLSLVPAGVAYEVVGPTGLRYLKANPSGQREWERLTVSDGGTDLPSGVYAVNVDGMDLSNLNFWRFSYRALGVPPSGPPAGEDAFYRIGRLVWYDTNENGAPDSGEPVIPDVSVTVVDQLGHIQSGVTGADGQFFFRKPAGSYTVVVDNSNFSGPLAGLRSTTGGEIETGVAVGELPLPVYAEAIFGYVANTPPTTPDDLGACACSSVSGTIIDVLANDSDANNDTLSVVSVSGAVFGTVQINPDNTVTYVPNAGFTGPDSFAYTVEDGRGGSSTGTVRIDVLDNPPTLGDDVASGSDGQPLVINVLANDTHPAGGTLAVTSVTQGQFGAVSINSDGRLTYTPNSATFVGEDEFTYKVVTECGEATAVVRISIPPPPPASCDASGYTTYTPGGWGAKPSGNNPGMLLRNNFTRVYPGGSVTIGSGTKTLTFTSASAIEVFLPLGGNPGPLSSSATNPKSSVGGPFIGHLLSLQLAADFSRSSALKVGLGNMAMLSGPLAGQTVTQILALANAVAGGTVALPSGVSFNTLHDTLVAIIMNYHEGTVNGGLLGCGGGTPPPPPPPPPVDPPPSTGSGVCSGGVTKLVVKYIGSGLAPNGVVSGQRSAPGSGLKLNAQVSGSSPVLYTFATTEMGGLFDSVSGGRLANNFTLFIGNTAVGDAHTSCSTPIYPGMKIGTQFEIVELWTRGAGRY